MWVWLAVSGSGCGSAPEVAADSGAPACVGEGRRLWECACEAEDARACSKLGWSSAFGADRDLDAARQYWESACRNDDAVGCAVLGAGLMGGEGSAVVGLFPASPDRAVAYLDKSCALSPSAGVSDGCIYRALAHVRGVGGPVDRETAKQIWLRDCAYGARPSAGPCKQLAVALQDE